MYVPKQMYWQLIQSLQEAINEENLIHNLWLLPWMQRKDKKNSSDIGVERKQDNI